MSIDEPTNTGQSPYELLGGEAVVRRLVDTFYDQMDEDPEFFGIRKLHPASLAASRDKLSMFLTGWLGGPPLYTSEFGHPRLRARHLPFAIGEAERDQWMACMAKALKVVGIELSMRERLIASFANTADWMRNREG
jgi:hemoglobin